MTGLNVDIKSNIKAIIKNTKRIRVKDMPLAVGFAMNDSVRKLSKLYNMNTRRVFDNPVKYTQSAFGFTKASSSQKTVNDKIAYVGVKGEPHIKGSGDPVGTKRRVEYMRLETYGGERTPKKRFLVTPAKHSKLNSFGNFPKTFVKTKVANKPKFFLGTPSGGQQGQKFNGIWERYGGKKNRKIRMVAKFSEAKTYRPLYPFDSLTRKFAPKIFEKELIKQINFQLKRKFKAPITKLSK